MAWYNKYRPLTFSEIIGQDLIKTVLQNAIKEDRLKHGYLFSGSRGVGKTSLARIFANQLNQTDNNPEAKLDIIELDAASNTGIDNIRQLIENAKTPPLASKFKIYIIDEVHMLSKSAMNALLKILEEPPNYLIFLLATTNPEKILPTVLSRLTKLYLQNHSIADLTSRLKYIAEKENLLIQPEALELIAKRSSGSQRDSINLLETIASYGLDSYDLDKVTSLLGLASEVLLEQLSQSLISQNLSTHLIPDIENSGQDGPGLLANFLDFLLEKSLVKPSREEDKLIQALLEILSQKLPITSITSAVALLQAKFRVSSENDHFSNLLPNPNPNNDNTTNFHPPFKDLNNERSEGSDSNTIIAESEIVGLNSKNIKLSVSSSENFQSEQSLNIEDFNQPETLLSKNNFQQLISSLFKDAQTPAILKMILGDLQVEEFSSENLTLSVSNNIFLAQLKSQKVLKFLQTKFESELNLKTKLKLHTIVRNPAKKNIPEDEFIIEDELESSTEFVEHNSSFKKPQIEPQNALENSKQKPTISKQKFNHLEGVNLVAKIPTFYKIYGKPIANDTMNKISVLQNIPRPKQTETWDSQLEMFEFE